MKKKILLFVLFFGFSLLSAIVLCSNDTYASDCTTAKNHLYVSSSKIDVESLGGATGVGWACGRWSTNSAVIFFADSVSVSNGVYTVYPDVELSNGDYTAVELRGMVHYHGGGTSTQYASHIGFCITQGSCAGTGQTGEASVNTSAEGGTAGGIIKSGYSGVLQRAGSSNPHNSGTDYWALPAYHNTIYIHNATLRDKIKNWQTSGLDVDQDLKDGKESGIVTLYIHRCFSTSSSGTVTSPSTCEEGAVYLIVKNVIPPETTYDGKVVGSGGGNTESTSKTVTFKHYLSRANDGPSGNMTTSFWIYHGKSSSQVSTSTPSDASGTKTLSKNSGWQHLSDKDWSTSLSLSYEGANNSTCSTVGVYQKGNDSGYINTSTFLTRHDCVSVHRYAWYDVEGRVTFNTNGTNRSGTYWVDATTANLQFLHQLKRAQYVQTKYKTSKNPSISNDFTTVDSYTDSTINTLNSWYTQKSSPSSAKPVSVAKDTGSKYCQTLYWYGTVREDSGNRRNEKNTEGCITFKRYKTTFTGSSKIYVNSSAVKDANGNAIASTTNIAGKKIYVYGSTYPVGVPITFAHTVTRSSNDPDGSPNGQYPHVRTTITKHDDVKDSDPHGTALNTTVGPLASGGSGTANDSFTVKVYPEHSIKLCQKMNYTSEFQGGEETATADASEVCVEIVMAQAECFGEKFGIKNGKNYLEARIFKNTSESAAKDSGVKTSGSTTITEWAKPGDQIRFNYDGCAGGELARQYQGGSGTTSYSVSTDVAGNLFGNTLSSAPNYNETSKTYGSSSSSTGTGPFSGGSFTVSVSSPHGSGIYSCSYYGTNNISNFYRIPAYIEGLSPDSFRNNCKSEDYGRKSDLGETIKQVASWSDIQYSNSTRTVNTTASITAQVKVPYNYKTEVETSGNGGYLLPGTDHTENIKLTVVKRPNGPVNGSEEYATDTKPSKYRLIEIVVGTDRTDSSTSFNDLVNGNEFFPDSNGSRNLGTDLDVCKSFNCNIVKSGDGQYSPDNNGINGQNIASYTREIPYNIDPGVKFCYLAAVWPSDSHLPSIEDITESDNLNYGMVKSGVNGFAWHVSGATCFTVAKRPSFAVLNGDTYAQRYISARVSKYPTDGDRNKMRIYGSWAEYGAIAGMSIKGYSTGASLWGGSNNVADTPDKKINCIYSSLTFSNTNCRTGGLGSMPVDTTASSSPKNLTDQIRTRFTRSASETERKVSLTGNDTALSNAGTCEYVNGNFKQNPQNGNFNCISDTGIKYVRAGNTGAATVSIKSQFCLDKGNTDVSHTTVFHSDGTLVIGANILYGSGPSCAPETYQSIAEVPQFIIAAKKIVIKQDVTHIDAWLIADEVITCDPGNDWAGTVALSEINTKNCNKQLTVNGSVLTKSLKLYRTYGAGFDGSTTLLASPAEVFSMGPESYFWSFGQAERYSQATTTYARELAPRY